MFITMFSGLLLLLCGDGGALAWLRWVGLVEEFELQGFSALWVSKNRQHSILEGMLVIIMLWHIVISGRELLGR